VQTNKKEVNGARMHEQGSRVDKSGLATSFAWFGRSWFRVAGTVAAFSRSTVSVADAISKVRVRVAQQGNGTLPASREACAPGKISTSTWWGYLCECGVVHVRVWMAG